MRTTFLSATLAVSVSALPQKIPGLSDIIPDVTAMVGDLPSSIPEMVDDIKDIIAPALDLAKFKTPKLTPMWSIEDVLNRKFALDNTTAPVPDQSRIDDEQSTFATCSNVRTRIEWDSYSNSDRQAYIDSIKCLHSRPASGQFSQSRNRYEDLVSLHQNLTPNIHNNAKFLLWHRYFTWMFEDILRTECGFNRALPWWDETKVAGRFASSSIFSDQWYGGVNAGGNCITNGQFANLALNVGPGTDNTLHCLARNNDDGTTAGCSQQVVDACNNEGDFANMARCSEGSFHAMGHNGIGAVMQDTFGSPGDPVFFLHHAFVDRAFRIWQNKDGNRVNSINGVDGGGNPLTLDTTVNVQDMRPTVRIRDILDTTGTTLCYKYDY